MKKYLLVFVMILMASIIRVVAQDNLKIQTKVPYYININTATTGNVFDIYDGFVSLEYMDNVGVKKEIELAVYNWKSEVLGSFKLDKVPGLNHYSFEFSNVGIPVELGSIYRCVMIDENTNKYELSVRNSKKPEDNLPEPSINRQKCANSAP